MGSIRSDNGILKYSIVIAYAQPYLERFYSIAPTSTNLLLQVLTSKLLAITTLLLYHNFAP